MSQIASNSVTNAAVYINGTSMIGRAEEVETPQVKWKWGENKPLGLVGSFETPDAVEQMEAKFKWQSIYPEVIQIIANPFKAVRVQVRASVSRYSSQGLESEVPYVAMLVGKFRDLPAFKFKQGEKVMPDSEFSCDAMTITIDGNEIVDYDALQNIYKVNGEDILAQYRANIGQS